MNLTSTCAKKGDVYGELAEFYNKKNCLKLYGGKTECLKLKNKVVFLNPKTCNLNKPYHLNYSNKEFAVLSNNADVWHKIDSLSNQSFPVRFYESLEMNLTKKIEESDIHIFITGVFKYESYEYCISEIHDNRGREWVAKFKFENEILIDTDLMLFYEHP